jgi:hypothetical protein
MPSIVSDSASEIISKLRYPLILYAVNPFSSEGPKIAKNKSALYRAMKSLGMNYKFPVCALPLQGSISSFKSFFGKCEKEDQSKQIAQSLYKVFKIPISKVIVQQIENTTYLCGLQSLKKHDLSHGDLARISKEVRQIYEQGDNLVG